MVSKHRLTAILAFFIMVLAFCNVQISCEHRQSSVSETVHKLFQKIADLQVKSSKPLIPSIEWQKDAGMYSNDVKLNMHGAWDLTLVRHSVSVYDNNMFVPAWVTSCLLEAFRFGGAPKPSEEQVLLSLKAIAQYSDRNKEYVNSLMNFWPLQLNKTTSTWQSAPGNLLYLMDLTYKLPFKLIEDFLKLVGLKELAKELESILNERADLGRAYHIPADFDDTFVNLGLGSLLMQMAPQFPAALSAWQNANSNVTSALSALKTYSYRPFSEDPRINTIDPRTYFYMREFLEDAKKSGHDLALAPTWIQDLAEVRKMYYKNVVMPFNINNIDVTVSANVLFGLTSSVLNGLLKSDVLNDPQIQQIYRNTTNLIACMINTDFNTRRDLALTYYPSVFEFYWFVARTLSALKEKSQYEKLPHPVLEEVEKILKSALQGQMTQLIFKQAKSEGNDMVFFDDFLGDGDVDWDNKTVVRGEDRIFTTAMAANALLRTWSVFDERTLKNSWLSETPSEVKDLVTKIVNWLVRYTLSEHYKPWNVFFSGSTKGMASLPFWYPANRVEFLNGTKITDHTHFPKAPYLLGFQGVVSSADYAALLAKPHFGERTPMTFPGFNTPGGFFPFWSSDAYTYSVTMLALSHYSNLE